MELNSKAAWRNWCLAFDKGKLDTNLSGTWIGFRRNGMGE